ncbi:MAG: sugar transferase [Propionibacteriaceae bacterium]|nr:sugar transferase [Propionibacteriaceae bacterium]
MHRGLYLRFLKRPLDVVLVVVGGLVFWWVFVVVALLVRLNLGKPVVFKQPRPGKDAAIFTLYKFRTMTDARAESGELLPDSERLTSFGRFLRSSSLDELPEFLNILRGEMSLVGPRPLAVKYLPFYSQQERRRHLVQPGLTGLAQVNGRNVAHWETRFALDVQYVERITFVQDMAILAKTVVKTLHRTDIGERGTGSVIDFDVYRTMDGTSDK